MTTALMILAFLPISLLAQDNPIINRGATQLPRVNLDFSVTFFLNAPGAKEVRFVDSVHSPGPPGILMTKDSNGVWSVTTPPYEAGTHYYGFVVDGVITGDIGGTAVTDRLARGNIAFELIDVRGSDPLFTDLLKVPHGTVTVETFTSVALDREVRCFVYTPPGFVSGERLPVVYLLHGSAQYEADWTVNGYAERIADNLISGSLARRVILAMPNVGSPGRGNLPADLIESYLTSEVIPLVEGKYLPGETRAERYLAGLSAGALHVRQTGLRNPSMFAGLGMFSGGGLTAGAVLEDLVPTLRQPELYRHMKFVSIAVGSQDAALANVQRLSESLNRLGVANRFTITSGGHTWFNWRSYLAEFLKGM